MSSASPQRSRTAPMKVKDRKSTRLNSSHTEIYTLSLHDALPIYGIAEPAADRPEQLAHRIEHVFGEPAALEDRAHEGKRSEEHTSELQSHRDLHSFPTRRSSDLRNSRARRGSARTAGPSNRACLRRARSARGPRP